MFYDRECLATVIPNTTAANVAIGGNSTAQERQQFAAGYNQVLGVLRTEFLPAAKDLTGQDVDAAKALAARSWEKYCDQQGNVERTLEWLRVELA